MKSRHTDNITIGRNLRLTLDILDGVRQREQRIRARRERLQPLVRAAARLSRLIGCTNTLNPPTGKAGQP